MNSQTERSLPEPETEPEMGRMGSGGGNTITPPAKNLQGKRWAFTFNNYNGDDWDVGLKVLTKMATNFIMAKEVGDSGTPHIQGYVEFKINRRLSVLKKMWSNKIHWERAKGNRQQNIDYCSKEGIEVFRTFPESIPEFKARLLRELKGQYKDVVWRDWQKDLLDILKGPKDPRKIYWLFEESGNTGKSFLTKYLALTRTCCIGGGKAADVKHQVFNLLDKGEEPELMVLDVPRVAKDYVSYQAIEDIKNGCFNSTKYEGGQCIYHVPHVVVFSNQEPDYAKMSADRWVVYEIKDMKMVEHKKYDYCNFE